MANLDMSGVQLGDAQMNEALARALPEHKRKLEITDEFSALCLGILYKAAN